MNRHIDSGRPRGGIAVALAAAALAMAAHAAATTPTATSERTPCFFITQWEGWKSPDPKTIYLGVNMHDVYRLDLSVPTSQLDWPDMHLISEVRGSDSICTALDLQLSVSDGHGFREPLFPAKLTKLTPEEAKAIPPKYRPN